MSSSCAANVNKSPELEEKKGPTSSIHIEESRLDEAAQFSLNTSTITPEDSLRVRKKIDKFMLPMMCTLYAVQAMDKATLGSAAILGIRKDTHLNANDNWLGTIFYVSYLIFQYPQNLALQRFPVGKWMSLNIFVWAIALTTHAACENFAGLFIVRFIMGACEGSITTGFLIVTSMFYTRNEQSQRIGYWFLMDGGAHIIYGFLSFGVLHIHDTGLAAWKWLMIITGLVTLALAGIFWLFFPDSPITAWFLTLDERKIAVERIKVNQTGIGNKQFKVEQVVECLKDPKTWFFALYSCLHNIPNSLSNQKQIIVNSFGFTTFQTTLLSCVDGVIQIVSILIGVNLVAKFKNSLAWVAISYSVPDILGSILMNALPWGDKIGLLFSLWVAGIGGTGFVLSLGWATAVTAGHTKRITTNAIMLSAYCIGNIVGPQMWQAKYTPRDRVPWVVITICDCINPLLILTLRFYLANENKRRDAEAPPYAAAEEEVSVWQTIEDGTTLKVKVDKAFLDVTDRQNRDFRYVL